MLIVSKQDIQLYYMEDQLIKNVLRTVKLNQHNMESETGIDTSLRQHEIDEYLQEAVEETRINK